jgi:hypothetical protein
VTTDRPLEAGLPVDRLIRAMGNDRWMSLVLAEPVAEVRTSQFRDDIIAEMRRAESAAQAERAESPLARLYVELLTAQMKNLTLGLGTGMWRTGVYLLGQGVSYYKLASLWQGLFSGERSLPEAVRVWPSGRAAQLAPEWALPTTAGPPAPKGCLFSHPLLYQTFLTSTQLAAYVHLPARETSGFAVNTLYFFDVEPPAPGGGRTVSLGRVKQHRRTLTREYKMERDELTRHALVAGYTGGGKTTTIFHLLKQVDHERGDTRRVPFLVLEPAKTEYQELQNDPQFWEGVEFTDESLKSLLTDESLKSVADRLPRAVSARLNDLKGKRFPTGTAFVNALQGVFETLEKAKHPAADAARLAANVKEAKHLALKHVRVKHHRVRVIRLGDETSCRFRMNPFEVLDSPEVSVSTHLDLLRAVFNASFGMWTPLPEVLEQCLYEVYRDYGWDLTWNSNARLGQGSHRSHAFPTLTDLSRKVDEVVPRLGYDKKFTDDCRGALHTRLNSLRIGGKGRMLDTQDTDPTVEQLFTQPTVLELEGVGSDDDKAFLMGLLLIRLIEYCRHVGPSGTLQRLLVIEEAHRLLGRPESTSSEYIGNPQAQAVETFSHLLSEIRAYGQGIIISDQSPVRLIPDVIKNTGLKIGHQIIGPEDQAVVGGAMTMEEPQRAAFATLTVGEALVFASGADAPVLVAVEDGKRDVVKDRPLPVAGPESIGPLPTRETDAMRDAVRGLVEAPTFQKEFVRLVVSVTEDAGALARLWDGFITREQAIRKHGIDGGLRHRLLTEAAAWFAQRRGRQMRLTYADTAELQDRLARMLLAKLEASESLSRRVLEFQDCMQRLHQRTFEPFPGCDKICKQGPWCLYRHAVADLISDGEKERIAGWGNTYKTESTRGNGATAVLGLAEEQALELIEERCDNGRALRRIRLCYAQHMLSHWFPETHAKILEQLVDKSKVLDP